MNLIERKNGNYSVFLYPDGTRIRECSENVLRPDYPDSIDLKITNFCDLAEVCLYCHEASDRKGKHADLDKIYHLISDLPEGTEIAIGGGNPLAHPQIIEILTECAERGLVPNLTVNQIHLKSPLLKSLINRQLIFGLGVSWRSPKYKIPKWVEEYPHSTLHMIAGVNDPDQIPNSWERILILGYKNFRNGKSWYGPHVSASIKKWYNRLPVVVTQCQIVAFDNLAIEQLNVKRLFCDPMDFETFFQGDEGTHSLYADAVTMEYATSSASASRFDFGNKTCSEAFANIQANFQASEKT